MFFFLSFEFQFELIMKLTVNPVVELFELFCRPLTFASGNNQKPNSQKLKCFFFLSFFLQMTFERAERNNISIPIKMAWLHLRDGVALLMLSCKRENVRLDIILGFSVPTSWFVQVPLILRRGRLV